LTITAFTNTQPGTYYVYANGNSGNITHTAFLNINVVGPDLLLTINPSYFTLHEGMNATSTITLKSILGFHGTVTLTAYDYYFNGPTVSLNSTFITVSPNATATAKLTISTSSAVPGYYNIQVQATGGNLTRYGSISVQVIGPDFTISSFPSSLSLQQGTSTTSTITLGRVENFNGTIALSASIQYGLNSSGLTLSISQRASLSLQPQRRPRLFLRSRRPKPHR